MADTKKEYEIGYLNGFYSALRGTQFILGDPNVTVDDIRQGVDETLAAMRADGDMEFIQGNTDEFLAVAESADEAGVLDDFFTFLDEELSKQNKESK